MSWYEANHVIPIAAMTQEYEIEAIERRVEKMGQKMKEQKVTQ